MNYYGGNDYNTQASYYSIEHRDTNWKLIPVSIIAGIIAWIICRVLYGVLGDTLPRPLLIGVLFFILATVLNVVLRIWGSYAGSDGGAIQLLVIFLLSVLISGAGGLFQFIYGLSFSEKKVSGPTSYIFIIDNSGSMDDSDGNGERYEAIERIMEDESTDFPYMVYGFDDSYYIMRDMAPKSEGWVDHDYNNNGGTSILKTLDGVIDDYVNGRWQGGDNPRVVLLTDGYATDIFLDIGVNKMLDRYSKKHISISCVGLGDVDTDLLNKIAEKTGGVFVDINNTSQLQQALKSAAVTFTESERDLVSVRTSGAPGVLYGFLRVLFLILLGVMITVLKLLAYGDRESSRKIVFISLIGSVVGALLLEICTAVGLPSSPFWLLLWILYSLTVADIQRYSHITVSS